MARFIAEVIGQAGKTSRIGSPRSGIWSHARGWDVGVAVSGNTYGEQDPVDTFDVQVTSGSNGGGSWRIARVVRDTPTGGWIVELTRPDGTVETLTYA